jgi:hypothetical protein
MNRLMRRALETACLSATALVGCNTILDNEPGVLVTETETDASTTLPEPGVDAGPTQTPTPVPDAGEDEDAGTVPTPGCADGQRVCNGACVSNADPLYGCGRAACTPCSLTHATATCHGTSCAVQACDKGWADCNASPSDGCETDLSKAATCGGCNAPCPAVAPNCVPSGASYACTNGCSAAAPLLCGKECVDPLTSTSHCGGCNVKCPDVANATTTCAVGICGFTCKPDFHACAGRCAQDTDPLACGAACTVCPAPPHAAAKCVAGACGKTCDPGFADCDAAPANGCEAALQTDNANCGACGKPCAPPLTCKAGVCG